MSISKLANSKSGMVIAVGVVVAALSYVAAKKAAESVSEVGQAINPLNNNNIFASGVNSVVQSLTGDENQTLGGWIYDVTH